MDATESLKKVENSLRDLINQIMSEAYGVDWFAKANISADKVESWKEKREDEVRRKTQVETDGRLIYYAEFNDIKNIIINNWKLFEPVFKNKKMTEILLEIVADYRNPDAHRRELATYQKELVNGISGELGNKIIKYRSKMETTEDCFPRIEHVKDSLGKSWLPGSGVVETGLILRPGDSVEFTTMATDPEGENLEYRRSGDAWQDDNTLKWEVSEKDISERCSVLILIRSKRSYHARRDHDDAVLFEYKVLPNKKS